MVMNTDPVQTTVHLNPLQVLFKRQFVRPSINNYPLNIPRRIIRFRNN